MRCKHAGTSRRSHLAALLFRIRGMMRLIAAPAGENGLMVNVTTQALLGISTLGKGALAIEAEAGARTIKCGLF